MKIVAFDFTPAPEEIRKSLFYESEDVKKASLSLLSMTRSRYVLLVTCNRVEVYTSDDSEITHTLIASALNLNFISVKPYRYEISNEEVPYHLFMLSTGVLSAYFGEEVILSQLKIAIDVSRRVGSVSGELNVLFQSAITFAKRVHTQMKVRVFDKDIIAKTVALVGNRKTLILGSGELARAISAALVEANVDTSQAIRDISKADFLVPRNVKVIPWEDRYSELVNYEAIVSASSSIGYTLDETSLSLIEGKLLVDLAEPSDFPLSFKALTTKDLNASTPLKDGVVKKVEKLSRAEANIYFSEMNKRKEYLEIENRAVDIASDSVRRLTSTLGLDKKTDLAERIYETIRKASINAMMRTRKY